MADSLSIGGTDLETYCTIQDVVNGWVGAPDFRGSSELVPRSEGAIGVDRYSVGPRVITIRAIVTGTDRAGFMDNMRALAKLVVNSGQTFTLTRVVDAGTDVTATATARYLRGIEPQMAAGKVAYLAIELEILSGYFYGTQITNVNAGTVSISGDATTRAIVLDLQEAGTLANSTLGCSVTVLEPAVLTVNTFTSAGGDISTMSWSGDDYWFALAPGSNTITWSGANAALADIAYQPAYL